MIRSFGFSNGRPISGCWRSPKLRRCPTFPCPPFVERLIGTIRREYLNRMLFWTTTDLENKLLDFRAYFNSHRTHASLEGRTPEPATPARAVANIQSYRWQPHCRGLYQTPNAA